MLPFWLSIAVLSLVQGALVALPGIFPSVLPERLRGRRWAVIPPASVIAFVAIASAAEHVSAQALTYLALIAVPLLAAVALIWLVHGGRALWVPLAPVLFVLAWLDRGGLAGEGSALILSGLSCVTLGVLIAAVTPPRWLAGGIVAMAVADTVLVVSDLLQRPNNALNAAHPAGGLPQLQSAVFGSAVMGYGDLFVAGVLGGLLAATLGRSGQLRGAALTAGLALCLDLLFFVVNELPATVPVALALVVIVMLRRRRSSAPQEQALPRVGARRRSRRRGAPLAR